MSNDNNKPVYILQKDLCGHKRGAEFIYDGGNFYYSDKGCRLSIEYVENTPEYFKLKPIKEQVKERIEVTVELGTFQTIIFCQPKYVFKPDQLPEIKEAIENVLNPNYTKEGSDIRDNEIFNLKTDIECVHIYLDEKGIPREKGGNGYSIVGRIALLEQQYLKSASEMETNYLRNTKEGSSVPDRFIKFYDFYGNPVYFGDEVVCYSKKDLTKNKEYSGMVTDTFPSPLNDVLTPNNHFWAWFKYQTDADAWRKQQAMIPEHSKKSTSTTPTTVKEGKEWEILTCYTNEPSPERIHEFIPNDNKSNSTGCFQMDEPCKIHSVKRLKDNTTFTIGDKLKGMGKDNVIDGFIIGGSPNQPIKRDYMLWISTDMTQKYGCSIDIAELKNKQSPIPDIDPRVKKIAAFIDEHPNFTSFRLANEILDYIENENQKTHVSN